MISLTWLIKLIVLPRVSVSAPSVQKDLSAIDSMRSNWSTRPEIACTGKQKFVTLVVLLYLLLGKSILDKKSEENELLPRDKIK